MVGRVEDGSGGQWETERLGGAEDRGLDRRFAVGVDKGDATKGGHSGSHVGLGDGVHWGGDAGDRKRNVASKAGGEGDGVGGEVDVVWKEDDVVICVGVALGEESIRGEAVLNLCACHCLGCGA